GVAYYLIGAGVLLALAGCGRSMFMGERAAWRHQAEVECMKSGAVKLGAGVVRLDPIEGPGMCGADFPLKVAALGEGAAAMSYGDDLRPPGSIPNGSRMPNWPINEPRYAPPAPIDRVDVQPMPSQAGQPRMRWVPGPPPAERAAPMGSAGQPGEVDPPGIFPPVTPRAAPLPHDIPHYPVFPDRSYPPQRAQPAPVYQSPQQPAPVYREAPRSVPALGPARTRTAAASPATLTPAATLACPLVSALDHWVSDGVQPAAMRWFG